jgi:hypothetical protein
MLASIATLISAVSAGAATGSLLAYGYSLRHARRASAREEALALAETRRQVIVELQQRVNALELRNEQLEEALARVLLASVLIDEPPNTTDLPRAS